MTVSFQYRGMLSLLTLFDLYISTYNKKQTKTETIIMINEYTSCKNKQSSSSASVSEIRSVKLSSVNGGTRDKPPWGGLQLNAKLREDYLSQLLDVLFYPSKKELKPVLSGNKISNSRLKMKPHLFFFQQKN